MRLTSTAFKHLGSIPSKYTCDGDEVNPPLTIEDVPKSAKSLVLIMDDPDAVKVAGKTSHNINATDVIWAFFKAHPKP